MCYRQSGDIEFNNYDSNYSTCGDNILFRKPFLYFSVGASVSNKDWYIRRDLHSFTGNIDY